MMDFKTYAVVMADVMQRIPQQSVDAYDRDATIFVIGNGGSATTATHLALDIAKNPVPNAHTRRVRCVALTDNVAALTAWANDTSYDRIFEEQLASLWRPGDVLLVITGSGASPNVVRAVDEYKHASYPQLMKSSQLSRFAFVARFSILQAPHKRQPRR